MRKRVIVFVVLVLAAIAAWEFGPWRERGADRHFDTRVADPMLATRRTRVQFDHAHQNTHSLSGRYRPFADLIGADGCKVRQSSARWTPESFRDTDVLVVVNARGPKEKRESAAFTAAECDAVRDWVRDGGALLLVADHHPCGEAAAPLAQRFGVEMRGGWTDDEAHARAGSGDPGQLLFTRAAGNLADHAITRGADAASRVDTVETFTGQSLSGPAESIALLQLEPSAIDRIPVSASVASHGTQRVTTFETADSSAAGRNQGLALHYGKGRVVVLAEAAMLTAQRDDKSRRPFGMNAPGNDDRSFTLNVVRWLAGSLEP